MTGPARSSGTPLADALAAADRAEAAGWPGDYAEACRQIEALHNLAETVRSHLLTDPEPATGPAGPDGYWERKAQVDVADWCRLAGQADDHPVVTRLTGQAATAQRTSARGAPARHCVTHGRVHADDNDRTCRWQRYDWPEEARIAAIIAIDGRAGPHLQITAPLAMYVATDILDAVAPILRGYYAATPPAAAPPAELAARIRGLLDGYESADGGCGFGDSGEAADYAAQMASLLEEWLRAGAR
jgi:hypothetical protein